MTYQILTLNNISQVGLDKLSDDYRVSDDTSDPDAILLRSYKMHDMKFPASLKAVGRAGAGVNNIPIDKLAAMGIPVFNAPGANANAVKELVLAGMLMSCRNLSNAWGYTQELQGDDAELAKLVEAGKKKFAGFELPGRTVGVVGLGAIGRLVANMCIELDMNVIGFDPALTVEGAWQLSSRVTRAQTLDEMLPQVDFITFHVPLFDATRGMLSAANIGKMHSGATVLNLARGGIVDDDAVCQAVDSGDLHTYVTDFPNNRTMQSPRVIGLPHLGASTVEAEDNCAIMVADQVMDFLENGNIVNSVNFPQVSMGRGSEHRLIVANANVPNMVGQISTAMASAKLNIHDMINQSRGDIAYTVVDVDSPLTEAVLEAVRNIDGVMMARSV
ncbi:MAG: phosphoglycerate dehydrogenase [Proteobacteria bacterium]|jgi:D-3-phosphoglycerate dehydrogenase / 2-oxoglutarate reductase|nr:phosphoglycerate dehydrogenase [Pseudomonadota bacterium]